MCCGDLVLSVLAALGVCVEVHLVLSVLAYVLAIYMYCGTRSAPGTVYVLAICIVGCLACNLMQEGSGPCKIPNLSHLLWSSRTYMYFVGHIRIDPRQS